MCSPQSFCNDCDKSIDALSLNLPPSNTVLPTKIFPFKNVPVVTITDFVSIVVFKFVFTPTTLPLFTIIFVVLLILLVVINFRSKKHEED